MSIKTIKKVLSKTLAFTLMGTFISGVNVLADEGNGGVQRIELVHFNDLHGNVEESGKNVGVAKLASAIKEKTSLNSSETYEAIPLSNGDSYQGTAISNLTYGKPVSEFLKEVGIVTSSIGNHEFDWGQELIKTWEAEGNFKFVAANIVDKESGQALDWVEPYKIVEADGLKIGIIGITTPETAYKTTPANVSNLEFLDPVSVVNKYADLLKNEEGVNAVVVLGHIGANGGDGVPSGEAIDLANGVTNVDAIMAAHDHKFTNVEVNGIKVIQAGYNGRALGVITFDFDAKGNIVDLETKLDLLYERSSDILPDQATKDIVNKYKTELQPILDEKITVLDKDLNHDRNLGLTPLGTVVAEAMRKITNSDIGITNGGGVRAPLSAGDLTIGDLYTILPFDNTLVTMDLKGEDVIKALEHGIMPESFGWGQFSGVKVWYDSEAEAGNRITSVRLADGTKLDPNAYYKVVVNDFMVTGGDSYDFTKATNILDANLVMRDEIIKEWKVNGVNSNVENLLVDGEDTTDVVVEEPETPEVPQVPEMPETPEVPEVEENKTETAPELVEKEEDKVEELPNTGSEDFLILGGTALVLISLGFVMIKKREEKEIA